MKDPADNSSGDDPPKTPGHDTVAGQASGYIQQPGDLPQQFGKYEIVKMLGEGGMGAVYLAKDSSLKRNVAIKAPFKGRRQNDDLVVARFQREAQAVAALNHPNICPVFEVGECDGFHFMAMAFIPGKTLASYVARDKPLDIRSALLLVHKIALTIEEAHASGVIHRDLKPSNIMIDQRNQPIIMDFGLARREDNTHLTAAGEMMGTPAYMPPEQVAGRVEDVGPGCDIYSLGVVLYVLLTGRTPFEGHVMATLSQIMNNLPDPPSVHCAGIDPALDALVLKALEKKIADRYESMQEFAVAITAYLTGERPDDAIALAEPYNLVESQATTNHGSRTMREAPSLPMPAPLSHPVLQSGSQPATPLTTPSSASPTETPRKSPVASGVAPAQNRRPFIAAAAMLAIVALAIFAVAYSLRGGPDIARDPGATGTADVGGMPTDDTGTEPGDTEPGDTEPGDTEPGDTERGDTKPGDTKPGDTKPGETKAGDTEPGDTEPGDTKPGDTKPHVTEPRDTGPTDTEPGGKEPGDLTGPLPTGKWRLYSLRLPAGGIDIEFLPSKEGAIHFGDGKPPQKFTYTSQAADLTGDPFHATHSLTLQFDGTGRKYDPGAFLSLTESFPEEATLDGLDVCDGETWKLRYHDPACLYGDRSAEPAPGSDGDGPMLDRVALCKQEIAVGAPFLPLDTGRIIGIWASEEFCMEFTPGGWCYQWKLNFEKKWMLTKHRYTLTQKNPYQWEVRTWSAGNGPPEDSGSQMLKFDMRKSTLSASITSYELKILSRDETTIIKEIIDGKETPRTITRKVNVSSKVPVTAVYNLTSVTKRPAPLPPVKPENTKKNSAEKPPETRPGETD